MVHFPFQQYLRTARPAIFEPHDLQHRHLPQFFTPAELAWREATYTAASTEARAVVAPSDWVRRDIIAQLGLPPSKVYRIRRAAPIALTEEPSVQLCRSVRDRLRLPEAFLFYPAQTWAHKNHLRLVEALARIAATTPVNVVCSGAQTEHIGAIRRRVEQLRVQERIRFVGHVTSTEVRVLYRLARGLIFPTLFEGYSLPMLEAFGEGLAVASSDVTCLPEIAGDAALLFDATSVAAISDAMLALWNDVQLRERLVRAGRRRLLSFDPVLAARTYRALYRTTAGHPPSPEDTALLDMARP